MRLAKYLAHSGIASRRRAEELIAAGRVTVGGRTITDPARDVDESSGVEVDGRPARPEPREVWMLNKPKGVVSTVRERGARQGSRGSGGARTKVFQPGRRRAVTDLVPSKRRLYPVGRLDVDTTGLILLTNDGQLANHLVHPRYEVPRTYRARLRRPPRDTDLTALRRGVELDDGRTLPARVQRVSARVIELTIREGRNRQVRRMAQAVGNEVVELARIRFGPLRLGDLSEGEARRLRAAEVRRLREATARRRTP